MLCIHGYGQTGHSLRLKSGGLRSESKKLCDWVFVDAPHLLSGELESAENGRTWWRRQNGAPDFNEYDRASLEASLETLHGVCEIDGPFDGLLGFSQGACLVAMLACRQAQGLLPASMRFSFAALFSGFVPHDRTLATPMLEATPATIASLHCFGAQDAIIPREQVMLPVPFGVSFNVCRVDNSCLCSRSKRWAYSSPRSAA